MSLASQTLQELAARLRRLRQMKTATTDPQALEAVESLIADLEAQFARMEQVALKR